MADAKALVDFVAKRADVLLDAAGDPRVGVMGGSYGGALGLMLAGADSRVDAVVAAITWNDLADAFFPQSAATTTGPTPAGREPISTPGPFKQVWATNFFLGANASILSLPSAGSNGQQSPSAAPSPSLEPSSSGAPNEPDAATCGRFDPTICAGFLDASVTGEPSDELVTLLRQHSPKPSLDRVTAPTLLVQGIADSLFGLEHADATARALAAAGTPVAMRWSDGGHDAPSTREAQETEAAHAWLDHYVRDGAAAESALPVPGFTFPTPASRRSQPADLWTMDADGKNFRRVVDDQLDDYQRPNNMWPMWGNGDIYFVSDRNVMAKSGTKDVLRSVNNIWKVAEYGGAPLMGVAGLCIVGHGRSSAKAVRNAVAMASRFASSRVLDRVEQQIAASV